MARLIRYVGDFQAVKRLRAAAEVDEHLERRAQRVAQTAEHIYLTAGEDVTVEVVQEGSDTAAPRARVAVIARSPQALKLEGEHRVMGSALDAARG